MASSGKPGRITGFALPSGRGEESVRVDWEARRLTASYLGPLSREPSPDSIVRRTSPKWCLDATPRWPSAQRLRCGVPRSLLCLTLGAVVPTALHFALPSCRGPSQWCQATAADAHSVQPAGLDRLRRCRGRKSDVGVPFMRTVYADVKVSRLTHRGTAQDPVRRLCPTYAHGTELHRGMPACPPLLRPDRGTRLSGAVPPNESAQWPSAPLHKGNERLENPMRLLGGLDFR